MVVARTDPQPERDNRADRPLTGRGWLIECPDCHRFYLVTREEIMSGSWLRKPCPHCADRDGTEGGR